MKYLFPASEDDAINEFGVVHQLATLHGWQLASLIYGLCEPRQGQGPIDHNVRRTAEVTSDSANFDKTGEVGNRQRMSFAELARRAKGVKSERTLSTHWHVWHDAGLPVPVFGVEIDLPEDDYPPTAHGPGLRGKFVNNTPPEEKAAAIADIMAKEPAVAAIIEEKLEPRFVQKASHDPVLAAKVKMAYAEQHVAPPKTKRAGALGLAALLGTSITALGDLRRRREDVVNLTELIQEHGAMENDTLRAAIIDEAAKWESVALLANEYAEMIRASYGGSTDQTFARLTSDWS